MVNREGGIFRAILCGMLTVGGVLAAEGRVMASDSTPRSVVESTVDRVRKAVADEKQPGPALDKRLRAIIEEVFDFDQMARSTVAAEWNRFQPAQRTEFVSLFTELLSRTYLKRIRENVVESKLIVKQDKVTGDRATIETITKAPEGEVAIDYRFRNSKGSWKVYDVSIENVGLISNYRTEFGEILQKDGPDVLLAKLRDKVAKRG